MTIKKYILAFCLAASLAAVQPSRAIGVAVGPSLGLAGYYSSFDAEGYLEPPFRKINTYKKYKVEIFNRALQGGAFMKLDLWLLYAKVDALFVWDWHSLPNIHKHCFKNITMPITIGVPLFNLLRPHFGIILRIPFSSDTQFEKKSLIKEYRKKLNNWLFGIGVDLGNVLIDLHFERGFASVPRKSVDPLLVDGDDMYTPKQFALKFGYNLLGLMK